MSNQYSHAYVLSHYEAQGLIHFNGPQHARPRSQHLISAENQLRADHGLTTQYLCLSTGYPSNLKRRIRIRSVSPSPRSSFETFTIPPHHRTESINTTTTEIHLPEGAPPRTEDTRKYRQHSGNLDELGNPRHQPDPLPTAHNETIQRKEKKVQNQSGILSDRRVARADDMITVKLEGHDARGLHSPRPSYNVQKRPSNETAIFFPETLSAAPPVIERQFLTGASKYLRNPPSPPPTPENRQKFSLDTSLDFVPPSTLTSATKFPSCRSPGPSLRSSQISLSSVSLSTMPSMLPRLPSIISRPEISTKATMRHGTSPSPNPTHNSFLRIVASPDFDSVNCRAPLSHTQTPPSIDDLPPEDTRSLVERYFSTDLEALPRFSEEFGEANLPTENFSNLDDDVIPWEKVKYGGMGATDVYRPSSPSVRTRASSFDSAAPPPIGLSHFNGPHPDRSRPRHLPKVPTSNLAKPRKSSRKSFFSIFHTKPDNTNSDAQQNRISDKTSARASVHQTFVPSVPTMSQHLESPWPHERTFKTGTNLPKAVGVSAGLERGTISNPTSPVPLVDPAKKNFTQTPPDAVAPPNTAFRQNGPAPRASVSGPLEALSDKLPPFPQAGAPPRGKSLGPPLIGFRRPGRAVAAATHNRRSWFNTDTLDRTFCGREARKRDRRYSEIAPGLM